MAAQLKIDHTAACMDTHTNVISSKLAYIYSHQTLTIMCYSYLPTLAVFLLPIFILLHTVRFTISVLLLSQETLFTSNSLFPSSHGFRSPANKLNLSILLLFLLLPAPTDLVSYVLRHGWPSVALSHGQPGVSEDTPVFSFSFSFLNNNRLTSCDPGNVLLPPSLPLCDSTE